MFRKRRNSGTLIYADTQSGEAAPKPPVDRKLRLAVTLLFLSAAIMVTIVSTFFWYSHQDRVEHYEQAMFLLSQKDYDAAMDELDTLGDFRDSQSIRHHLSEQQAAYDTAMDLLAQQRYSEAVAAFRALGDYADCAEWAAYRVTYQKALDLIWQIDLGNTQLLTRILPEQVRLTDENSYPTVVGYEAAAALLESLGDYRSAPSLVDRCYYSAGMVKLGWNDWNGALAYMEKMTPATAAGFFREYQQRYDEHTQQEGQ